MNVESNCRSTPLTKTDYYYETYTSKPFSAPFRAESFATNYIGDFRVQCSYKEKKGKTSSIAAVSTTAPSAAIGWMPGWRR